MEYLLHHSKNLLPLRFIRVRSCWVLPFGSMETVLHQQGLYDSYCQLLEGIDAAPVALEVRSSSALVDISHVGS